VRYDGMKDFIESLSIGSGAALIAILSALIAWLLSSVRFALLRWSAVVLLPLLLSYCLYWLPVWLGGSSDQYDSWEPLVLGAWFPAGVVPSVFVILVVGRCRAKRSAEPQEAGGSRGEGND